MSSPLRERLFRFIFGRKMARYAGLPGPTPKLLLGNAQDFTGDRTPWSVCDEYAAEYGGHPVIWLLNKPVLVLSSPEAIDVALGTETPSVIKKDPVKALLPVTTRYSIFTATQKTGWKERRASHPFVSPWSRQWTDRQVQPMRAFLAERIRHQVASDRQSPDAWSDLVSVLLNWSFDSFAVAAVGRPLGQGPWKHFIATARTGNRRINLPVLPTPPLWPPFYWHRRKWYGGFADDIARARTDDTERVDLLASMLKRDAPGDDATIQHMLGLMFYGGVFSVSAALLACLFSLAKNPEARERLSAAVRRLAASGDYDAEAIAQEPYIEAVVREGMRVLPPVPLFMRQVASDASVTIGDHEIPAGTTLWVTNLHAHHNPEQYPDPGQFRPERWLDGGFERHPIGSPWFFPFGRGPRMCLGADFAMTYMKVALATIIEQAQVTFQSTEPYGQELFFGVVRPKNVKARFLPA